MPIDDEDKIPVPEDNALPVNQQEEEEDNLEEDEFDDQDGDYDAGPTVEETFMDGINNLPVQDEVTSDEQAAAIQETERGRMAAKHGTYDEYGELIEAPVIEEDERIPVMEGLESQPNWSPLSSFPHFENTRFRAFIRNLFSNYTQVPVEQIFRSSENYKTEQWLTDNAVSQGVHTVDFSQIMPGVSSMVEKFTAPGAGYLKVTDRGGVNLYTWREAPAARPDAPGM